MTKTQNPKGHPDILASSLCFEKTVSDGDIITTQD